jgi:hypothetical protein
METFIFKYGLLMIAAPFIAAVAFILMAALFTGVFLLDHIFRD